MDKRRAQSTQNDVGSGAPAGEGTTPGTRRQWGRPAGDAGDGALRNQYEAKLQAKAIDHSRMMLITILITTSAPPHRGTCCAPRCVFVFSGRGAGRVAGAVLRFAHWS